MCVNNDKYTVRICIYAHPFPCRLQILHFKHHRHGRRQPFQVEGPTVVGLIPNHRLSNFNASFPKPTASVWKCLPPQKKKVGRPYVWPQIGFESVISPMVFLKSPWKKKSQTFTILERIISSCGYPLSGYLLGFGDPHWQRFRSTWRIGIPQLNYQENWVYSICMKKTNSQ